MKKEHSDKYTERIQGIQQAGALQQAARLQKVLSPTMSHPLISRLENTPTLLSNNQLPPTALPQAAMTVTSSSSSALMTSSSPTDQSQVDCKIETILDD